MESAGRWQALYENRMMTGTGPEVVNGHSITAIDPQQSRSRTGMGKQAGSADQRRKACDEIQRLPTPAMSTMMARYSPVPLSTAQATRKSEASRYGPLIDFPFHPHREPLCMPVQLTATGSAIFNPWGRSPGSTKPIAGGVPRAA